MEPKYLTINKKDNKLLYFLDTGLDKFVMLVITIARFFVPSRFKNKFDKLIGHKDMLHNVVGLAFFNALGGLCIMATQVKLANYLGASVYGIYSYSLAIGEVGAMFVRYGRDKTMVRDLIQNPEKRDSLVVSTFFLSIINLAIFLAVTFVCHKPLDIEVSWTNFLLIMSPCLASLTLGPLYESLRMMSWSSIYGLLQKFAFLAAIWTLLFTQIHVSLFAIGVIVVSSWLIVYVFEYHEVITQLHINFIQKVKLSELWNLYKENFVIFLSCVTGVAFGPLLRLILNNYTDSASVGIYAAGLQVYSICLFLNTQISRVGNPMMAQAGCDDCTLSKRRKLVFNYALIMLGTSLPFAAPMMICPGAITDLLFTNEYSELANYLPLLAIYMVFITLGVVFEQLLISNRRDKTYFVIYVLTSIETLLVAYWLIPTYGLQGAFLSLCIPRSIGAIAYVVFSIPLLHNKNV